MNRQALRARLGFASASSVEGFEKFQSKSYFSALDGLRAVSILLVLLHHSPTLSSGSVLARLQENGRYGVGFFFVISGFLICTLFLREEAKTGRIDLWKLRRALRLMPLYYAVLMVQLVLAFGLHQYTPENQQLLRDKLPSYLFYYSNWLPTATQGPFFCAWSLAVEEQFYLGFGFLLFFARRPLVVGLIAAILLLKVIVYQLFGAVDATSVFCRVVFSYREPILLGVLLAFMLNERRWYDLFSRWLRSPWVTGLLGIAICGWICGHMMRHESAWDSQILYLLMTFILAALVIRSDSSVFSSAGLRHVGKISYGIYLIHMFVLSAVKKSPLGASPLLCFLTVSILVIALASLIYKYFEYPIINFYKRKLSPVRQKEPVLVPAATADHPGITFPVSGESVTN